MKKISLAIALLSLVSVSKAQHYLGKNTVISFFSAAKLENIEAKNAVATSILNTATGDIVVQITNTAFKFKSSLMEEHFNENYMESKKFPVSDFKGKINEKPDYTKDGTQEVTATGKITMHGVSKDVTLKVTLEISGKKINAKSKFKIKVADYGIKVPSLYVENIAEEVEVTLTSALEPYVKK